MTTALNIHDCVIDGSHLIEASAGTGKTWTICGLYLRLLLEKKLDVQQILVVTFTNAATAELRDRIRTRIAEKFDECKATDDTEATQRLDLALQTFDEAAIFTIHGFCQRALADTPFTAHMPLALELVEDDTDLRAEAVNDFWRRRIAGTDLDPAFAAFLLAKKDTPERLAKLLKRHVAKPLAATRWPENIDQAIKLDTTALASAYAEAKSIWQAGRAEIMAQLMTALPSLNANSYKEESVQKGATEWDAFFRSSDPLGALDGTGTKLPLYRASIIASRTKKKCTTPVHVFFDAVEAFMQARETVDPELELTRLRLVRDLLGDAGTSLRTRKREQRLISFDDMLSNLYERLAGGECPWLAGSLRTRFPAALIDEFQDTDPLQWNIFKAIYSGSEAALFLVGDPKQAIYSFRNADLHTYLAAKQHASQEHSLTDNQRSTEGLIKALNALFQANDQAFLMPGLEYHPVAFGEKPRLPFLDTTVSRGDLQVWMLPSEDNAILPRKTAFDAVAKATAVEIARLANAGHRGEVLIGTRSLQLGDIAVLVRSHRQGAMMKEALATLGLSSVELSQASVFGGADAEDVERVLAAILEPTRDRLLRGALATELMGMDAAAIDALARDEAQLMAHIQRFAEYRQTWLRRGVGFMFRQLLSMEQVSRRMLARNDGERRLTNLLHLGECLHQAAETHPAPDALLHWFQSQRSEKSADEVAQLRLESDQNLIQIVTIHKSKGLEYPVVFCPFLWDGYLMRSGDGNEGHQYHDEMNQAVIDMRGSFITDEEGKSIKAKVRQEDAAEFLRLVYVALTRAVYRCYLVAGSYTSSSFGKESATASTRSLLNWMVAGQGNTWEDWIENKLTPTEIHSGWTALAQGCNPHIQVAALPEESGVPVETERVSPESLSVLVPPAHVPSPWRIGSYSGMSHGASHENAASDHDLRAVTSLSIPDTPEIAIAEDDILCFPRGTFAGECLHALFENADFTERSEWGAVIESVLDDFPQRLAGLTGQPARERLSRMLVHLLENVLDTPLIHGLKLNTVTFPRRLTELEFNLPAHAVSAPALNDLLHEFGYDMPRLVFSTLEGYLKGFIDLVFEHAGRYYLLDWKSNHLGCRR